MSPSPPSPQDVTLAPWRAAPSRPALATVVLATAQLMLVLDVTVVNVALPDIETSLGLGRATTTWVMTIYTTLFGGLVLAGGRMADGLGARRVLVVGLGVFMAASLIAALATGATMLLVGRALQGLGAALVSPAALAVLLGSVSDEARGRALAIWGSLSAVGTAVGVSVGGLITAAVGWEWIFAINVPIGLAVLATLPFVTRPMPGVAVRPDLPGTALVTLGTALLVFGLVRAGDGGWLSPSTLAAIGGGLALWLGYAAVERVTPEPVLRLSLLREPRVAAGAFLMVIATGLMVGNFFIGSFTLQRAYGDGPLQVGLQFLAPAVAVSVGANIAGQLLDRIPARTVAIAGFLLAAAGEALAAVVIDSRVALLAGLSLAALGIGALFVTAFRSALAGTRADERGLRSAVVGTAHELGGAIGVAVLSTAAAGALTTTLPATSDFVAAYTWAAVSALCGAVLAGVLVPGGRPTGHHD